MFGMAGRRAAEILVGLFALLGFVCVPLGTKTGLQHLIAIVSTDAVRSATHDLVATVSDARSRLLGTLQQPEHEAPAPHASAGPRPRLPHLGQ